MASRFPADLRSDSPEVKSKQDTLFEKNETKKSNVDLSSGKQDITVANESTEQPKLGDVKHRYQGPQTFVNDECHGESRDPGKNEKTSSAIAGSKKNRGGNYRTGYRNYDNRPFYNSSSNKYGNKSKNYDEISSHRNAGHHYKHEKPQKREMECRVSEQSTHETLPSGAHNSSNEPIMGSVVNGRYVRKVQQPRAATNSEYKQNNYKSHPQYHDAKHKYGGKTRKSPPSEASNQIVNKFTHRNEFTGNHSFNSTRHTTHKNFKRKDKYSNDYKTLKDDLTNSDEMYLQENTLLETTESSQMNLAFCEFVPSRASLMKKPSKWSSSTAKEVATQRDRLIEQLEKGECECMVCCELIRTRDQVWSCGSCYHVFHLRCIKKWARSPTAIIPDCGWRCPGCQNISEKVPYNYYCFCGKCKEPEVNHHYTPHSCGEVCGKERSDKNCTHRCNLLCHPGPCPTCAATVTRSCSCGKTKKTVPCNQSDPITCNLLCEKMLNCDIHKCSEQCHIGDCKSCSVKIKQTCYCGRNEREILCEYSTKNVKGYCCNMVCNKQLTCMNHKCFSTCHTGPCPPCALLPNIVLTCACGKHSLKELCAAGKAEKRTSCADPVPVCGEKCQKVLSCGPKGNPHKCNADCHSGECPPCPLSTSVRCQCGATTKEMPCIESSMYLFQCEKRCNRRKECGRHKCLNHCCVNIQHKCEMICNKKLSCGLHHCQELCHGGRCPTCWNVSFDELRCHCGKSVLYPPIQCGTKPPECNQQCTREHACGHDFRHSCHSDASCPPCTVFTTKWCFGHHEQHSHIPCFLDGISCGKRCSKPLPCGRHTCKEACHQGPCLKGTTQCTQLCEKLRSCGHPCAMPCHDGDCPNTTCKAKVDVSCPCGHRKEVTNCSEDNSSYRLMSVSLLATKMHDIRAGELVNISDLFSKKNKGNRLQCNEECAILERNKRLAVALQIQNPELSCKPGPPCYSEFLKEEARKSLKFISNVYDKFTELVQLAKQTYLPCFTIDVAPAVLEKYLRTARNVSKQKSRSYAFPPMNRDQRRVIHEMAEFFGCETQSYDEEPVKNVVITAFREKSWLPFVSIMDVIQREMGVRKGPVPLISQSTTKTSIQSAPQKKEKPIDYFDFDG